MHPNEQMVERLYTSLNGHLPGVMAECYHSAASFHDIAFDLRGKPEISAMWDMICTTTDIRASFEVVEAQNDTVIAKLVDEYTFAKTGRKVRNVIESRFRFQNGLIIEHIDSCDPHVWGSMAIGGISGFFAGRLRFLRSWKARGLLRDFERRRKA